MCWWRDIIHSTHAVQLPLSVLLSGLVENNNLIEKSPDTPKPPYWNKHANCGLHLHQPALQLALRCGTLHECTKMMQVSLTNSSYSSFSSLLTVPFAYYFLNEDMQSCPLFNFTQPQSEKREEKMGTGWGGVWQG